VRRLLLAGSEGPGCSGARSCGGSSAAGCRMPGHWQPQSPPATDMTSDSRLEPCAAPDAPGRPHSPAPRRRCRASQSRTSCTSRCPDLPRGSRSAPPRGADGIHSRARAWAFRTAPQGQKRRGRTHNGLGHDLLEFGRHRGGWAARSLLGPWLFSSTSRPNQPHW
jgi:hypothetical protein